MSKITDTGMSRSEALIMDYLWEEGTNGKMFSEFMAYLSNNTEKVWAKQTVNTFLRRLIDKGLIRTEMRGRKKCTMLRLQFQSMRRYEQDTYLTNCMKVQSFDSCQRLLVEEVSMKPLQTTLEQ